MPITDLTGYTWVANNILNISSSFNYSINFYSSNNSFSSIDCDYYIDDDIPSGYFSYFIVGSMYDPAYSIASAIWFDDDYKVITFSGGTDVTNSTLIAWLEANGTLTAPAPQPSTSISIGNLSLAKSFIGNTEVSKIFLGDIKLYEKSN